MSNYLSLASTIIVQSGAPATEGSIKTIVDSLPKWTTTLSTLSFSSLSGSTLSATRLSVSTLTLSTLTTNRIQVASSITASSFSFFNGATETIRLTSLAPTFITTASSLGIGTITPQSQSQLEVNGIHRTQQLNLSSLAPSGPAGFQTEVNSILNMNLNFRGTTQPSSLGSAFRLDARDPVPVFQWLFRPVGGAEGGQTVVANINKDGRLLQGYGSNTAITQLETVSGDFVHYTPTRTGALDHYASILKHDLITPSGFRASYARSLGGTHGTIATSAQSQVNGFYGINVADGGVFVSDGLGYPSQFCTTSTHSWFNTSLGVNTSTITSGVSNSLEVNGVIRSTVPSWYAYVVMGGTPTAGQTITYNQNPIATNVNFNAGTGRMTATVAGKYHIVFHAFSESGYQDAMVYVYYNNAITNIRMRTGPGTVFGNDSTISAIINLAVGDYIDLRVTQGALHYNENIYFTGTLVG